jgi:HlyD family secretion protein
MAMPKGNKDSIIRSEDVQEILSTPPHALLRMGSSVIGGILLVLFIGCFIFKYPDTITCTITITKTEPPVWIVAKASGRLQELYAQDGQHVNAGDVIAVIENPANTQDVLKLDSILSVPFENGEGINLRLDDAHLGSIQSAYTTLARAITDYNNFVNNNLYNQRIAAEEAQLKPYLDYVESIEKQVGYSQRIKSLSGENYQREKILHDKGLTSTSDLESTEQSLLGSNMTAEQIRSSLANAKIQMAQIHNTISELKLQKEQERQQQETTLLSAWEGTRTAIREWEQTYLLQSPIEGTVSFNNLWKINQIINSGDKAFSIISNSREQTIGKAKIPVAGSGKVKVGQRINIQLDGYPYLEYGFLTGCVTSVAKMPDGDIYTATFELQNSQTTSYGKTIRQIGDLSGVGEIITDDLSVAERIIGPLKYLFHRNFRN